MILFCATAPTALFFALSYKMAKHRGEKAAILIHKGLYKTNNYLRFLENLVKMDVFSHIFCQEKFLCLDKSMPEDAKLIEERFVSTFDNIFKADGMSIQDFDKIYFITDDWNGDFGLYLFFKKVPYYWLDMNKVKLLTKIRKFPSDTLNHLLQSTRAFSAMAEYATPIVQKTASAEIFATLKKYKDNKYQTWSPTECLEEIKDDEINKIIECNNLNREDLEGISLVLFNSCGAANMLGAYAKLEARKNKYGYRYDSEKTIRFHFHTLIYALAVDMYMKEYSKLFLKIHPNERLDKSRFSAFFGGGAEPFASIPFELIILYLKRNNIKMNQILSIDSISDKLVSKDIVNHPITLGRTFFKIWSFYFSLYIAFQLYLKLKKPDYQIYVHKPFKSQFENIAELCGEKVDIRTYVNKGEISGLKNSFVIVDERVKKINKKELLTYSKLVDIVLVNVELQSHSAQDELDIYQNSTCIKIRKKPLDMSLVTAPFHYDEYLWIRTSDKNRAQVINQFYCEMKLKVSNLEVSAQKMSLQEEAEYVIGKQNFYKVESMKNMLVRDDRIIKYLTEHMVEGMDDNKIRTWLRGIYDIEYYLEAIRNLEKKYTVLLAVRDTPGDMMPASVVEQVRNLGFHTFVKDSWMTYVGMITSNHLLCDKRGDAKELPVEFEYEYHLVSGSHSFHLSSQAWRKGDKASIIIDEKDYSVNMRGLNFVILNIANGRILDSVGIDMHENNFKMAHA